MKRIFILAAAFFTSLSASFAQTDIERTFTIGPAVGFGHTYMRNVGYDAYFKPNWSAGITMNYSQWEHVGFAGDVLYSMEGGEYKTSGNSEIDITLHYLRIPLKFAYFFGDQADRFRPKITLGPSFGFLIDESTDVKGDNSQISGNLTRDHKNIDLGGIGSLGFNYRMGERVWLNTDLYYYHGFLEVDDVPNLHHYNTNMGIRVGVAFGL